MAMGLMIFVLAYVASVVYENSRRDKLYGKPEAIQDAAEGFVEKTDKVQRDWRYTH